MPFLDYLFGCQVSLLPLTFHFRLNGIPCSSFNVVAFSVKYFIDIFFEFGVFFLDFNAQAEIPAPDIIFAAFTVNDCNMVFCKVTKSNHGKKHFYLRRTNSDRATHLLLSVALALSHFFHRSLSQNPWSKNESTCTYAHTKNYLQ